METKFNFNSAICTTIEQSARLLALGLKKETADMCWMYGEVLSCNPPELMVDIPAWSLHRLIELMPFNVGRYNEFGLFLSKETLEVLDIEEGTTDTFWDSDNVYDNVIGCIEWLIKEGYFNKDYLV